MTIFQAFKVFVANHSALAAKVPGGVVPQYVPQNPASTFQATLVVRYMAGATADPTHDSGTSSYGDIRIEVTYWGTDFVGAEQTIALLRSILKSWRGALDGTTNVYLDVTRFAGPRTVNNDTTRLVGLQFDILATINWDTVS